MNTIINDIFKLIAEYPKVIQLILITLLLLSVITISVLRVRQLREAIIYFIESRVYKINSKDIRNHKLFREKYKLKHRINTISFDEKYKEDILKLFYNTKLEVDFKNLEIFVKQKFNGDFDFLLFSTELFNKMQDDFDIEIHKELQLYCQNMLNDIEYSKKCAEEIYRFVMFSKNGFVHHRLQRIEDLISSVELIYSSPLFDNNNEEVFQLFDILHVNINNAVMRVGQIFLNFNGQIKTIIEYYQKKILEKK